MFLLKLKNFLVMIARWPDLILQCVIRPKSTRVCYTSSPDYSDNPYHLFRHALQTRDNLEHIWLVLDPDGLEKRIRSDFDEITTRSHMTGNRLTVANRHSLRGYWLFLTSGHIFHTHGIYHFPRWAIKRNNVSLWHGMPIKRVGKLNTFSPNPYPTFATLHTATSHFFRYVVAQAFNTTVSRVLVTPYPRCDALTHATARTCSDNEIRHKLAVDEDKKLVLWLPTYRTEPSSTPTQDLNVHSFIDDMPPELLVSLSQAAVQNDAVVVIKLHQYDRLNELGTALDYPNLQVIKSDDWQAMGIPLYDLVAASAALLSDVSSILIDYLATGRPIGIIGLSLDNYDRGTAFPLEYLFASGRYRRLENNKSIDRFIENLDSAAEPIGGDSDPAHIFFEPADKPGSEIILSHIGL